MNIIEYLSGPHEWGYRDIAEGGFIEDRAPFEAAGVITELLEALQGVLEGLPFAGNESEYELVQAGCTPTEAAQLSKAFTAIARATGAA